MSNQLDAVPRTSFRLPFGIGFGEPLKADSYDSENLVIGRTAPDAPPAGLYLGKLAEFEQMRRNVWLECHGAHAVYLVGKRRSGKSYTLGALCEGLVANSWLRMGAVDQAVLLIDTLNIYGTLHVTADMTGGDTRLWQLPSHVANVRYVAPEVTRSTIAAESTRLTVDPAWLTLEDWCGFFDVDAFADPLGHLLGVVLNGARERWQQTASGIESSGVARTGIEDCIYALDRNPEALHFEESTREALRRRLLALERLDFFARPSPMIEDLLAGCAITVCQLRDLDDRIRSLIVAVLIREVIRARARADAAGRLTAARARLGDQMAGSREASSRGVATPLLPRRSGAHHM